MVRGYSTSTSPVRLNRSKFIRSVDFDIACTVNIDSNCYNTLHWGIEGYVVKLILMKLHFNHIHLCL